MSFVARLDNREIQSWVVGTGHWLEPITAFLLTLPDVTVLRRQTITSNDIDDDENDDGDDDNDDDTNDDDDDQDVDVDDV